MTDLLHTLPSFSTARYSHVLPNLDKALITVADLLTLDASEVARRAQVPAAEVRKLSTALLEELHTQCGLGSAVAAESDDDTTGAGGGTSVEENRTSTERKWSAISTLDTAIDVALGGGIPTGYITEVTGER